jgi:hypothetical protein
MRVAKSVPPPGVDGTIMRIGRSGYAAHADGCAADHTIAAATHKYLILNNIL